ncbi:MAG: hypothetical protein M0R74_02195 [Dehalococcoidia bacterium]|nr:hypothetical protein [Dehalococcoidia bacterium]
MGLEPDSLDARRQEQERIQAQRVHAAGLETGPEMTTNPETLTLSPGDSVVSADGREIGSVQSVRGGYFELEALGTDRFWLSSAYVATARDGRVELTLSADGVTEHRLHKPGLETVDPNLAGTGDRVRTSLEALQMRERIEQELLEQRGTIDTGLRDQR